MRQLTVAASAPAIGVLCGVAAAGGTIGQLNHYMTGFNGSGTPLTIPAIDPAGICYHAPSGHVFITDSEIEEVPAAWAVVGANVFEVSLSGNALYASYDVTVLGNSEPTGITYNEFDGFFYMTDDITRTISRYSFSPATGFALDDSAFIDDISESEDCEGIDSDPQTGLLYVVDGFLADIVVLSYSEASGFVHVSTLDLGTINDPTNVPIDPEGVAFNTCSDRLYLVTDTEDRIYEFTLNGLFIARYDLADFSPLPVAPQGLAFAPTSATGDPPSTLAVYIADGYIDNNVDPDERDGGVYEANVGCSGGDPNHPPVLVRIPDQSISEGAPLSLTASASDPDPGDAVSYSLLDPVPAGASINPVTGLFTWTPAENQGPEAWTVTVRAADDGVPQQSDQDSFVVTVSEINQPPVLDPIGDRTVLVTETLQFTATATDPDVWPGSTGSLVAHWSLDSGFTSTTGTHHGTPLGGAAITMLPGESVLGGGALSLDGVDDHVSFGDVPLPGDLTVAAWVRPLNINIGTASLAVVLGDSADDDWIRLESNGVRLRWNSGTNVITTQPDFVNGSWQHLAVVRDGTSVVTYRNGVQCGADTETEPFTPEFIGHKRPTPNYYWGLLDDVALWDGPLSAAQIGQLYNGGAGLRADDLVLTPGTGVAFSLEGDVPPGATIDPDTGTFSWTAPAAPVSYTFTVRASDDGNPPLSDSETITVAVIATCPADLDGDGQVGIGDLLIMLAAWGTSGPGDLDGSGAVGITDLLSLLKSWGPCP
jgi:hypothetical protein